MALHDLEALTVTAYIECALWSGVDSAENPLDDNYTISDVSDELRDSVQRDVETFVGSCYPLDLVGMDAEQLGHDLCLTRNGHGTGFWDRGYGAKGERLTVCAQSLGESHWYVGDDGKVYAE